MIESFVSWLEDSFNNFIETTMEKIFNAAQMLFALLGVIALSPFWILPFIYWYFFKWKDGDSNG